MEIIGFVILGLVLTTVIWATVSYNHLVRLRNEINNAFAQIDVQLKRRYDLIPNLVEVARKYITHESETLEAVVRARNQAAQARGGLDGEACAASLGKMQALAAAEGVLGSALGRLMAVVEAYPDLKADQNLRELSEELTTTENRVGFSRQAYNDCVLDFNNKAQQFPEVIIANLFSFKPVEMLRSTENAQERQPVKVQF